jgi:hypothetical protein
MDMLPATYDEYISMLDGIGDSILEWSDPEHLFSGHTKVRSVRCVRCGAVRCGAVQDEFEYIANVR